VSTAAPATGNAIELADVAYRYRGSEAGLTDIGLVVPRGTMTAIIGPNGSGKTTLLRILAGLVAPAEGRVLVCGHAPGAVVRREFARRVAVVGTQSMLGFPYTVLEVVLMGRAPHIEGFRLESDADLACASAAMEATGVWELSERIFDTLSSGERQRVAMARALAQEPELMLLDEPSAFLDIKQQTVLYDLLADLNEQRQMTVVSVLHDLNLASLYFDQVVLLNKGRIHATGAPAEVITYASVREVYETDVYVDINDLTGKLNVLPLPRSRNA
jgi:iron complex transport system ATP-binding protein